MKRRVIGEGAWVLFGQGASALGVLVGVRLLTELLAPATFGELALVVGIAALAVGLVGNPLMQAVLRYYPDSIRTGDANDLRASVTIYLVKAMFVFSAIWLSGWWVYSQITSAGQWYGLLVVALLAVDLARSLEVAFFNAARRQRSMALTMIADSWGRPTAAVAAITLIGATVTLVVVSYVIASLVLLAVLFFAAQREGISRFRSIGERGTTYDKEVLRYALPLVPLGLVGWICNFSDRYVLAGISGLEQAGLYAAVFAVASRPAWLLGGAVETTLRPIYFHAVSGGNGRHQVRVFRTWLILQFAVAISLAAVFWLFNEEISFWLLGERYRTASSLMPWIAGGSGLVVVAQAFAGLCYANRNTTRVLRIEIVGAIARVTVGYPAIYAAGIEGAAIAVPVASAVQLAAAVTLARNYVPAETSREEGAPLGLGQ
jgi:O-antigen/teichoic acid export membrane protein